MPQATGGVAQQPVSGTDTLLGPGEIKQLIAFADAIPKQFPQLGEDGKPVAADVEFAFVGGTLWLLQIRPFNESREARGASYLVQMDKALAANLQPHREHARGDAMRPPRTLLLAGARVRSRARHSAIRSTASTTPASADSRRSDSRNKARCATSSSRPGAAPHDRRWTSG